MWYINSILRTCMWVWVCVCVCFHAKYLEGRRGGRNSSSSRIPCIGKDTVTATRVCMPHLTYRTCRASNLWVTCYPSASVANWQDRCCNRTLCVYLAITTTFLKILAPMSTYILHSKLYLALCCQARTSSA
ncbi:hypothetical protein SEVIR_6G014650v4 [Setaria viridis]